MVGKEHRLCPLQVCITRHHHILVAFCLFQKSPLQFSQKLLQGFYFPLQVHPQVQCHLIVAAAACVELPAWVSDLLCEELFDVHVDIFCCRIKFHFACFYVCEDLL